MSSVRGRVISGRADFGTWIERLRDFYERKTGMRFIPVLSMSNYPFRIHFRRMSRALKRMSTAAGFRLVSFHAEFLIVGHFCCARIGTKKARGITREILLRSLPISDYATLTTFRMVIGSKSNSYSCPSLTRKSEPSSKTRTLGSLT
jgi:hypothetical protein